MILSIEQSEQKAMAKKLITASSTLYFRRQPLRKRRRSRECAKDELYCDQSARFAVRLWAGHYEKSNVNLIALAPPLTPVDHDTFVVICLD